jgi:uncharacterized membrane protein
LKLRISNGILIIDILSILLIVSIIFIPSTVARVILGLPFLMFFPGYTLTAVLFVKKEGMSNIEWIALSFGMSIAVTALIGFGLNYTPWGIRLESVLYSMTAFIFATSTIAIVRRILVLKINKFTTEFTLCLRGWERITVDKLLSIIIVVVIIIAFGTLGYTIVAPKIGERFTEFYIVGIKDKAEDYPTEYVMNNGQISQVIYSNGTIDVSSMSGKVTVTIVNHEQQAVVYSVKMTINGEQVDINSNGTLTDILGPIYLKQGEKWENEIGITPDHVGDNQKVELSLFKGSGTIAEDSLHFWINVKQGE